MGLFPSIYGTLIFFKYSIKARASRKSTSNEKRHTRKHGHSSRIKYLSPFLSTNNPRENIFQASNEPTKTHSNISSSELSSLNLMNEQIIGLEFICIVGSNVVNTLDELEDRRTRTTTLTPENESLDTNGNPGKNIESNINPDIEQSRLTNVHQQNVIKFPNQIKKKIFYTKFQNLNVSCLLDLIDEKDMTEFKSCINKHESSKFGNESSSFFSNNVKVYLRFNWYSFNELNSVNHNHTCFSTILSNANSNANSTSKIFGPTNSVVSGITLKFSKAIASSNSNINLIQSLSQKGQQQSNLNETLSTHSSSSTVCNQNVHSSQQDNHKMTKMHHKFEYYHLLYPKIYEFK
jgi:hypothetical protein